MTTNPLVGLEIKLRRAQSHIADLDDKIGAFYTRTPFRLVGKPDPTSGLWVVTLHVDEPPDPSWGAIVGDAVHNLRSALDLLWRQLWYKPGTAAYLRAKDGFPVFATANDLEARFARVHNARQKKVVDVLRTVRPYDGGNDGPEVLQWLSNEDKHTVFMPAYGAMKGEYTYALHTASGKTIGPFTVSHPGLCPIVDGAIVARLKVEATGTMAPARVVSQVAIAVTFGESPTFHGEPIIPLIKKLGKSVAEVVEQFRPLLNQPVS